MRASRARASASSSSTSPEPSAAGRVGGPRHACPSGKGPPLRPRGAHSGAIGYGERRRAPSRWSPEAARPEAGQQAVQDADDGGSGLADVPVFGGSGRRGCSPQSRTRAPTCLAGGGSVFFSIGVDAADPPGPGESVPIGSRPSAPAPRRARRSRRSASAVPQWATEGRRRRLDAASRHHRGRTARRPGCRASRRTSPPEVRGASA